jgi:uncharacterized protein with FMN-binding domain
MRGTSKLPLAVITGLTLAGALAACSSQPAAEEPAGGTGGSEAPSTGSSSDSGEYADGTYTATGSYQAPSGQESVEVTLTLDAGVVADVEVVGEASDPQAQRYQGQFVDGIGDVVVGQPLDGLQVDKVGGSSLTSGGFNDAVEQIKADAAA